MNDKLTMIELFSGIGAQERALRQLGIPYEIIRTCDCDKDVVLSYAAMRFNLEEEMKNFNFPSKEQMIQELQDKNMGYDFQKSKHTINSRMNEKKVKQYYLADKLINNLGDISMVEKLPYADMVTYSSPCQSFSVAGKLAGAAKTCNVCGNKWDIDFSNPDYNYKCPVCGNTSLESTTSGLLAEVQRLLSISYQENTLPKYLVLENVKNLVGKKFKPQFDAWCHWLDSIGYNTYYKVLNAKNYEIAQNRERVFAISIRKDIDDGTFKFPTPIPLTTRLKDILEKNVDEKYYLSGENVDKILNLDFLQEKINNDPIIVASRGRNPENPSDRTTGAPTEQRLEPNLNRTTNCLTSVAKDNYVLEPQVLRAERTEYGKAIRKQYEAGEIDEKIGNMREMKPRTDGIANTLTTVQKDNYVVEPIIVDDIYNNRPARIYDEAAPTLRSERTGLKVVEAEVEPKLIGGIGEKNFGKQYRQGNRVYDSDAIAMALNAQPVGNAGGYSYLYAVEEDVDTIKIRNQDMTAVVEKTCDIKWSIRKLTPLECWRLMGFSDEDCKRAGEYVSASALYKQAGNSIVTNCLVAIFYSLLFKDNSDAYTKYLVDFNSNS